MRSFLLLLVCATSALAQVSTNVVDGLRSKDNRLIALVNCTAVTNPQTTIDSATIIIRNDKIVSVGRSIAIPEAADVRDLRGAWVYAGFVDPYVDVADLSKSKPAGKESDDSWRESPVTPPQIGALHWNQAVRPDRRVLSELNIPESQAKPWHELGYTSAGVSSHDGIFSGNVAAITIDAGSASDVTLSDNVAQRLSFTKGQSSTPYPSSLMGSIALIRQTLMDAEWYSAAMAQRNSPGAKTPDVNLSLEALAASVKTNQPFIAVTTDEHDYLRWQTIAREANIKLIFVGNGSEYRRAADVSEQKPTIILPLNSVSVPDVRNPSEAREVGLNELIAWYWAADNARLMDSLGCKLAFTLNSTKNKSDYLDIIRSYVKRGLPRSRAIAALTTVPSEILGINNSVGTIAANKLANLVIASGDLFDDKTTIVGLVLKGTQHTFNAPTTVDVRGEWTLTSAAFTKPAVISIAGTDAKPTITCKVDSTSLESTIQRRGSTVSFTINTDSLGATGIIRASAMADSILINGKLILADGSVKTFVMRRDKPFEKKLTTDEAPSRTFRPLPSTLPLGPFGYDEPPAQEDVILKNATVWTSADTGVLAQTDVKISGGKIVAIGKGLSGGTEYNCEGKHITPGIIDEHSHIAIARGVNEGTHAVTTEVRIGDVVDPDDIDIYRQLAGGVTASHLLHGSANPMGGQLQFIRMRWGGNAEDLKQQGVKPTVKFALGENVKQSNWGDDYTIRYPQTRMGVEEIMRDAFQAAREYEQQRNAASIGGSPVRRDLQLDALVEILNGDRYIHCHSYQQSEILMLMRLAEEFGFRVHTFTHILEGYKVAQEMAKHGAMASTFSDWWAYKFEVYQAIPENGAIMHEQGVTVSVNSDDAEMARRLNQEAAKSISYGGVNEETALQFVTKNAAIQMDAQQVMGTLEVGNDADVVVWSGNPLSNLSKVERTFVEGRQMFSLEQDAALRARDAELRAFLEQEALRAIANGATTAPAGRKQQRHYHCDDIEDEMREESR